MISDNTPLGKYLKKIRYYDKYIEVWFAPIIDGSLNYIYGEFHGGFLKLPQGMSGQ